LLNHSLRSGKGRLLSIANLQVLDELIPLKRQPWALPLIFFENMYFILLSGGLFKHLFPGHGLPTVIYDLLFDNYGNLVSNRQSDEIWIAKELQQLNVFRLYFGLCELLMLL
jgi:hypothetical protein